MELIDLTPLFNAIIAILAAVITPRLVRWLNAKASAEELEHLYDWVKIAVAAAEQIYPRSAAESKKKYVLAFLEDHSFSVDTEAIDRAIEAAVLELHAGLYGKDGGEGNE